MDVMTKPIDCSARKSAIHDRSRDRAPRTSSVFHTVVLSLLAGVFGSNLRSKRSVDLREPLKPWAPADDQAIALPWASVMVIMVLLNVEFTWATPEAMFLRSRRFDACGILCHILSFVDFKRCR